jgi:AmiR/NasT family two-component response regulator
LTDDQHADALVMAGVVARAVLDMQAHAAAGALDAGLESGGDFRFVVHQAAGMVSVQLGVGVGEAFIRLRAYAFSNERPLTEVAESVVSRQLRFE